MFGLIHFGGLGSFARAIDLKSINDKSYLFAISLLSRMPKFSDSQIHQAMPFAIPALCFLNYKLNYIFVLKLLNKSPREHFVTNACLILMAGVISICGSERIIKTFPLRPQEGKMTQVIELICMISVIYGQYKAAQKTKEARRQELQEAEQSVARRSARYIEVRGAAIGNIHRITAMYLAASAANLEARKGITKRLKELLSRMGSVSRGTLPA